MLQRVIIQLSGDVQTPEYRGACKKLAKELKITGYLKNVHDQNYHVELVIEGEGRKILDFAGKLQELGKVTKFLPIGEESSLTRSYKSFTLL